MAKHFNGSSFYLRNTTFTSLTGVSKFTLFATAKRTAAGSLMFLGHSPSTSNLTGLYHYSDGNIYMGIGDGGSVNFGYFADNTTSFKKIAFSFDGSQSGNSGRLKGYLDGVAQTLSFTNTIPASTLGSGLGDFYCGYRESGAEYSDGDFGECAIWSDVLSDEEHASLGAGFSPRMVRPTTLLNHWRMVNTTPDEPDNVGHSTLSTLVSVTLVDGPSVIQVPLRRLSTYAAAVGANVTTAILGAGVGAMGSGKTRAILPAGVGAMG